MSDVQLQSLAPISLDIAVWEDHLEFICQVERRRDKNTVDHGVEVALVQGRVDGLPAHPPLVPPRHSKTIPKQKLRNLQPSAAQ